MNKKQKTQLLKEWLDASLRVSEVTGLNLEDMFRMVRKQDKANRYAERMAERIADGIEEKYTPTPSGGWMSMIANDFEDEKPETIDQHLDGLAAVWRGYSTADLQKEISTLPQRWATEHPGEDLPIWVVGMMAQMREELESREEATA